ncbi:hypothetical protein Hdeb2414_s0019g00543651 [Helianthus debilis subsp. tardiflorus]
MSTLFRPSASPFSIAPPPSSLPSTTTNQQRLPNYNYPLSLTIKFSYSLQSNYLITSKIRFHSLSSPDFVFAQGRFHLYPSLLSGVTNRRLPMLISITEAAAVTTLELASTSFGSASSD